MSNLIWAQPGKPCESLILTKGFITATRLERNGKEVNIKTELIHNKLEKSFYFSLLLLYV